ncbi:MAG: hypothetical protein Q8M02_02620 [Candidatus Didemnitutus sp.]|nr:hypothetical protein [Candidatus Didemnitutus sp.]
MKRLIILVVVVAAFAGWLGVRTFLFIEQEAKLVIENASGEQIADLSVKVWNHKFALGMLPSGEKKEVRITEYSDSAWSISGRWDDGTALSEQAGYITHGMGFDDRAVFGRDRKLVFSSKPR